MQVKERNKNGHADQEHFVVFNFVQIYMAKKTKPIKNLPILESKSYKGFLDLEAIFAH